jgi:hypothetical protein
MSLARNTRIFRVLCGKLALHVKLRLAIASAAAGFSDQATINRVSLFVSPR